VSLTWGRPWPRQRQPEDRGRSAGLKVLTLVYTYRMAKKPEPRKPIGWNVYKIASKAVWLGEVEAPDETPAIEKPTA
jgi:hypothetical protein